MYSLKGPEESSLCKTHGMHLTNVSLILFPQEKNENITEKQSNIPPAGFQGGKPAGLDNNEVPYIHTEAFPQDWWHCCSVFLLLRGLPHNFTTMNFLRRRLSDSSFVANLPNGYMMDLQRPDNSTSSPVSPAMERKHPQPPQPSQSSSTGTSIFSSISSAMKQTTQAAAGLIDHSTSPSPPVAPKPKILLVIDDAHTEW